MTKKLSAGDRITALRTRYGLTQEQLGEELGGVSRSYLSKLENDGGKTASKKFLARLAYIEANGINAGTVSAAGDNATPSNGVFSDEGLQRKLSIIAQRNNPKEISLLKRLVDVVYHGVGDVVANGDAPSNLIALSSVASITASVSEFTPPNVIEVDFYEDIAAGHPTGLHAGNAPLKIAIPPGWNLSIDFVVKAVGHSMPGILEDGQLGAFIYASSAISGEVVAALVEGQVVVKLFNDTGKGTPLLLSTNPDIPPIICTEEVIIQGKFKGPFPFPASADAVRLVN